MIRTRTTGPFTTVELLFEPIERIPELLDQYASAARVRILSYEPLPSSGVRLVRTKHTPLIHLRGASAEEVVARFSSSTRTDINKTKRMDTLTMRTEDTARAEHYELYRAQEEAQGRLALPEPYFTSLILFGAYHNGVLISGIAAYNVDDKILKIESPYSARLSTTDHEQYRLIGRAGKRLVHDLVLWAHERGFAAVDQAYVNLTDPNKKGIDEFKLKFGGEVTPEYHYVKEHPLVRIVYPLILLKVWLLKLRQKLLTRTP